MAWPAGTHLKDLIVQFNRNFQQVRIRKQDQDDIRAFVELEGWWKDYRIIVSEIHRRDGTVRYTYYVFNPNWQRIYGFDNSADNDAIRLKYGPAATSHLHEELPHQHTPDGDIRLTDWVEFEGFLAWVQENL